MSTPSAENLLLGAGALYFDRIDNATGKFTGERHLGNCTAFTFAPGAEVLEKYSSMDADRSLYKAVVKQVRATGKITLDEFDPHNLAMAMLGDNSVITQSSGSVLSGGAETFVVKKGHMYKLGGVNPANQKFNIDPTSIALTKGATPLVKDRDFIVTSGPAGVIFFPDNLSTILVDGDSVNITYNFLASTMKKIVGGTNLKVEGYIRFIGDPTTGPRYDGDFWRVSVTPEGDLNFIGDDWGQFNLTFECMDDSMNHASEPFYRLIKY